MQHCPEEGVSSVSSRAPWGCVHLEGQLCDACPSGGGAFSGLHKGAGEAGRGLGVTDWGTGGCHILQVGEHLKIKKILPKQTFETKKKKKKAIEKVANSRESQVTFPVGFLVGS